MNFGVMCRQWVEEVNIRKAVRRNHLVRGTGMPFEWRKGLRVLVVRWDRVGDVLLTTPFIRELKSRWRAHVTMAVSAYAAGAIEGNVDVDAVVKEENLQELRTGSFDVAVDPFVGFSLRSAMTGLNLGIRTRLGYESRWAPYFFTHWRAAEPPAYEARQHLGFLDRGNLPDAAHGGGPGSREDLLPILVPTPADQAFAEGVWRQGGWTSGERVAIVNPGSRRTAHRWGADRYARVAGRLARETGVKILVTWGPGEQPLAQETASLVGSPAFVAPATTIGQLGGLLRRAGLFLGADSGPFHVAVSQRTPAAAVFGGSDADRWAPRGISWIKVFQARDMRRVDWEVVSSGCRDLLQEGRKDPGMSAIQERAVTP